MPGASPERLPVARALAYLALAAPAVMAIGHVGQIAAHRSVWEKVLFVLRTCRSLGTENPADAGLLYFSDRPRHVFRYIFVNSKLTRKIPGISI